MSASAGSRSSVSPFWMKATPLCLASGSPTRRLLLQDAGIPVDVLKAPVDEAAIAARLIAERHGPQAIAVALAKAKAEAASRKVPDRLILAADQTLDLEGELLMKPASQAAGRHHLAALRGRVHILHSAAVLRLGEKELWSGVESVELTMRPFSDDFLAAYAEAIGPDIVETVGGYRFEGIGAQLFAKVDGPHAAILGLPLGPIFHALRDLGYLMR